MNKEIAKKWIEALRSGKYKQGKQILRSIDDKYCCLGVLCDVYITTTRKTEWKLGLVEQISSPDKYYIHDQGNYLPREVVTWANLNSIEGSYKELNPDLETGEMIVKICTNLTNDNDTGKTFQEIADIIQENYKNL